MLALVLIVFNRTPVDSESGEVLQRAIRFLHRHGVPTFVDYGLIEFTANIVMFVPFGVFWFLLASGGWRWFGPAVGVALSFLIEVAQYFFLPQRFASPYDVLANGLGAYLGTLLAWAGLSALGRAHQK